MVKELLARLNRPSFIQKQLQQEAADLGINTLFSGSPSVKKGARWFVGYRPGENTIYAQEQAIIENFRGRAKSIWGGSISARRERNLAIAMQSHEVGEAAIAKRLGITSPQFGSHAHQQVIEREFATARKLGRQAWKDTVQYRKWEQDVLRNDPSVQHLIGNTRYQSYTQEMPEMIARQERLLKRQAGFRLSAGVVAGLAGVGYLFSGKDDAYNIIEGLSHKGEAARLRKIFTDFGSGYQGLKEDTSLSYSEMSTIVGGATIGGLYGYHRAYPWMSKRTNLDHYPRLTEIRRVASKNGFRIFSPEMARAMEGTTEPTFQNRFSKFVGQRMYGGLKPMKRLSEASDFSGVIYMRAGEYSERSKALAPRFLNWGNWDIGVDKYKTYKYLQERGREHLYAKTLGAHEFYDFSGKTPRLSDEGRKLLARAGGTEGLVVKEVDSALGKGVWTRGTDVPQNVAENILRNPHRYLFQERLNLKAEFRVVTVGDKAVFGASRFGSSTLQKVVSPLKKILPNIRWGENIEPVWSPEIRKQLFSFAEQASKDLPYEIGAFDIGLTKGGSFKVIEAQRAFGSITNPVVSRRIQQIVTGKMTGLGKVSIALGAVAGSWLGYNLFSGKDDAYNIFEGINHNSEALPDENRGINGFDGMQHGGIAQVLRKENTAFGSKYDRMKYIAEALDITFDALRKSKAFKESLAAAVPVKGGISRPGAFGHVQEMKTTLQGSIFKQFQGEEISLVRKTIKPGAREELKDRIRGHAMPDIKRVARGLDLSYEARALQKLEAAGGGLTPSVYQSGKKELLMEKIEGEPLDAMLARKQAMPDELYFQMKQEMERISGQGVLNLDVHTGNIIWNRKTQQAGWVDFGVAQKVRGGQKQAISEMREALDITAMEMEQASVRAITKAKPQIMSLPSPGPQSTQVASPRRQRATAPMKPLAQKAQEKIQLAELQKQTLQKVFGDPMNAGRRHMNSYARRIRRSRDPFSD